MTKLRLWLLHKLGGEPKIDYTQPVIVHSPELQFAQFRACQMFPKETSIQDVSDFLVSEIGRQMYAKGYIVIEAHSPIWPTEDVCVKYTAKACAVKPGWSV